MPASPDAYAGLCFMGGPMSVNDPLPWVDPVCALIRAAVAAEIPVIGHCLGGQLISKALGGAVTPNPVKEIGWGEVIAVDHPGTAKWLGKHRTATVFQWHGETFSLPPGATPLLTGQWCANQAFALGPHLGLQFHSEMLPEVIAAWCQGWSEEMTALNQLPPSVQTPEQMLAQTPSHLPAMRELADQLYSVWIAGLRQ